MTLLIDQVHLLIQAGDGGNGCESVFRRTDKKVVPNGGDGGKGGSVIIRATKDAPPLGNLRFKQHLVGESGAHGGSNRKRGKNGKDLILKVPIGTRILDREKNLMIRYLQNDGDEVVVCKGGNGGVGNDGGKEATFGQKGGVLDVELSFRLTADYFMVGLPNSGKSAILNRLTRAHTKEEHYPFATHSPELGVHQISDYEQVTLCELPSIYQASHEGRGMGADFLKHLELAKVILFVLDPCSEFAESPADGFAILKQQIKFHDEEFLKTPYAIIINKMDLPDAKEAVKNIKFEHDPPCFQVSAKTGEGFDELKQFLRERAGY